MKTAFKQGKAERMQEGIVVWDCGATNASVLLVALDGRVLGSKSRPTEAEQTDDGLVWPVERFWVNFCELTRELLSEHEAEPRAVNITTFGVCWGAVDAQGELIYPVISWKCQRTQEQLEWAEQNLDLDAVYEQTGAPPFYFNTAFSLRWLRDRRPEVLEKADAFLMMPQLFVERLTGERAAEQTMATTSMLYDLERNGWAEELFEAFDVPNKFPKRVVCPSDIAGEVHQEAAEASGLPAGTPVCAGGHDTAVAVAGACRDLRESLLYSTGTWSILVGSRDEAAVSAAQRRRNILWQRNPHNEGVLGGFNIQGHMIGGLAFDLVRRMWLPDASAAEASALAAEAEPGSGGVLINPTFVAGTGPRPQVPSAVLGWADGMDPGNAVRAVLEGLAFQTRDSKEAMGAEPSSLLVGGGFAKNELFGQILADVLNMPVELSGAAEVTALGAAALAMVGVGAVDSAGGAWKRLKTPAERFEPTSESVEAYERLYARRGRLMEALGNEA